MSNWTTTVMITDPDPRTYFIREIFVYVAPIILSSNSDVRPNATTLNTAVILVAI